MKYMNIMEGQRQGKANKALFSENYRKNSLHGSNRNNMNFLQPNNYPTKTNQLQNSNSYRTLMIQNMQRNNNSSTNSSSIKPKAGPYFSVNVGMESNVRSQSSLA